ncbi:MAG: 2-C-methyl-D-erythritol 4-phosphate cytidylyltransferase [Sulfobacillus benefaciens]|uniref:2-C-methyl-D-erythritol 4-phosphate cytidylyltransferase n=1 Tax=Sulfobacillus benefaciens TaxID=453960 RepID=A0A2T2XC58_9FIRM|nr:MAG: 2-C-methyl-D-erythritol 4-phosphate cytidylyltransferase [Sulfobacillus benefaciens]
MWCWRKGERIVRRWGLVVAAGGSHRMAHLGSKLWLNLAGHPALRWSLAHFIGGVKWDGGVIVCRPEDRVRVTDLLLSLGYRSWGVADGGVWRHASVQNGLSWLSDHGMESQDAVLVHDAARLLVDADLIDRVLEGVVQYGAAIPVVPIVDTVKRVREDGAFLEKTEDRARLTLAQTPQGFLSDVIGNAYRHWTLGIPTDDAQVVEQYGHEVAWVPGNVDNRKLTTPEDVAWFEWKVQNRHAQMG